MKPIWKIAAAQADLQGIWQVRNTANTCGPKAFSPACPAYRPARQITPVDAGAKGNTQGINDAFGQITDAYRDITVSGTNDPGGRVIEFVLRVVF